MKNIPTVAEIIESWSTEQRALQVPYVEKILAAARKLSLGLTDEQFQGKSTGELAAMATDLKARFTHQVPQGYMTPEGAIIEGGAKEVAEQVMNESDPNRLELTNRLLDIYENLDDDVANGQQSYVQEHGQPDKHDDALDEIEASLRAKADKDAHNVLLDSSFSQIQRDRNGWTIRGKTPALETTVRNRIMAWATPNVESPSI